MTEAPQGGAPPENETAAQVGKPGQRRDFDNSSSAIYTTTDYETLSASLEKLPEVEIDAWCERHRIPVVLITNSAPLEELVASGAPAWIATDYWCSGPEEMAFAIQHATYVISFEEIDDNSERFFARAVSLAALGERVVYAILPDGLPLQPVPGRGH